jgi:DMSO/TMAO reductase YedYZ heme-binding membrane subunit
MKKNIGSLDGNIRITLAIVLSLLFLGKFITGTLGIIAFIIGIAMLLTSLVNFCPLYKMLGFSTFKDEA